MILGLASALASAVGALWVRSAWEIAGVAGLVVSIAGAIHLGRAPGVRMAA